MNSCCDLPEKVGNDPRPDGIRRGVGTHRVAVRLDRDDRADANRAAGPTAILHDDQLTELSRKTFKSNARDDIGRAAGAVRNEGLIGLAD